MVFSPRVRMVSLDRADRGGWRLHVATQTGRTASAWTNAATGRGGAYAGLAFLLILGAFSLSSSTWQTGPEAHTLLEVTATLLALFVAAIAFVRYYTRPTATFLFVATAFLGTALLDGYHAVVTTTYVASLVPSTIDPLIAWSWLASRMFLSGFLWLSYLAWRRRQRHGAAADWISLPPICRASWTVRTAAPSSSNSSSPSAAARRCAAAS